MVKTYKRSDKVQLSKNFRLDEFKCKCGKCDPILLDTVLVDWLQKLRDHFGKSIHVNSGYRCKTHNASAKVGGSPTSHHVKGMAADIRIEGVTPKEVAKYAESIGIQRIGLYDTFVHIGSDAKKSFWLGHEHTVVETFGCAPQKTVTVELPVLKKGCKGDSVMALQALLIGYGYDCGDKGADGSFGVNTLKALTDYQEDMDLEADGSCGKETWSALLGGN
jgi:hypothetical protein